jgi:hypothetical protein
MYSTYILGEGGSGNIVDRQPQKFALRGDSIGVWGGGGEGVYGELWPIWATMSISYPNESRPVYTPTPKIFLSAALCTGI